MTRFAHGRWDREQPHSVEKISDGAAEWGQCSCGWQGELRSNGTADADCEEHERYVFLVRKAGFRMIRGRVE